MNILDVDTETFYDKDYSLSKMQTDAYILDPRFEIITMCVIDKGVAKMHAVDVHDPVSVWQFQTAYDWADSAVRCHHTQFDGFILTRVLGVRPKLWMDTLALARMHFPWLKSHSLSSIAKHMKLPAKGNEVVAALGKRRADFNPVELAKYEAYCENDTWLAKSIGDELLPRTPALEIKLIDTTVRMFTEPVLVGDQTMMHQLHVDEITRKADLLQQAGVGRDVIMSNPKFADALRVLGVSPPMKVSQTTKKVTYAFAKSDKEFTDLLEHDDEMVQALVAARLGVKTTIAETRALRFLETARRGLMPVYLQFWGAKTTGRYSGGNKINWQNIPARGPAAGLRQALRAPDGHVVMAGDSSNIELRVVMAVAGQTDVLDKLRKGVDLYCDFASDLFGRTITKADKWERFLGKTAMLGLQYGAGAERFMEMVRQAARASGIGKPITLDEAHRVVNLYRAKHYKVVELWRYCNDVVLPDIANGCNLIAVDVHGWCITQNDGFGRPGEPGVVYKNLRRDPLTNDWVYEMAGKSVRIFGPKVVENLCQHLARQVVMWQTARIDSRVPVKLSVHDEAVTVPRIEDIEATENWMTACLSLAPPWCRDILPVACEVNHGPTYADCK